MSKPFTVKVPKGAEVVVLKSFSDSTVVASGKSGSVVVKKASKNGVFSGVLMGVPVPGRNYVWFARAV